MRLWGVFLWCVRVRRPMVWRAGSVGVLAVALMVSLAGLPAQAATAGAGTASAASATSANSGAASGSSSEASSGTSKYIERKAVAEPGKPADPKVRKTAHATLGSAAAGGATPRSLNSAAAATDSGQSVLSALLISPDLNCAAMSTGYVSHPGIFFADSACGTFLWVDGTLYGPASVPAGPSPVGWTPVSQQTTGAGTTASPFITVTTVAAGTTGVTLTESDSFVAGGRSWTTSVAIGNPAGASVTRLSHGQDCYVAASDTGNGQFDAATHTTFCEGATAAIALTPLTAGNSFVESSYSNVWSQIIDGGELSDTFYPPLVDNGQAVSWGISGAASGAWSWRTTLLVGAAAAEQGGAANAAERQTTCSTARPVNCATGDFWHTFTDIDVASRGLSLLFSRTYDAANAAVDGPLGYGWTDSLDMSLTASTADGTATVNQENGSPVTFTADGHGGWTAPARVLATLTATSDGGATFLRYADHLAYHFDTAGVLRTVSDRDGDTLTLAYTAGQVTSVTDGAGRHLTLAYTGSHLTSVADPLGRTTHFGYDAAGNLSSATDPLGRAWAFGYDASHRLLTSRDPRGSTTTNTYDSQGRVAEQTQPDQQTISFSYSGDPASTEGATNTLTDIHGIQTVYSYVNMLLVSVETGVGTSADATTSYTYDIVTLGRTSATDAGGFRSQQQYDTHGNIIISTDAAGATSTYSYDDADNRTSISTPNGETALYAYDVRGHVTSASDALGKTTTFTYGDSAHPGDLTKVTDPDGHVTTSGYDAYGQLATRTVTPVPGESDTTVHQYDADGELVCTVSATQHAAAAVCPA
ncbi:MAG: hypothetical protein QOF98_387, partial [Streptomyces sp.]|nr:hypothetical protein [Streptomyces sp.]